MPPKDVQQPAVGAPRVDDSLVVNVSLALCLREELHQPLHLLLPRRLRRRNVPKNLSDGACVVPRQDVVKHLIHKIRCEQALGICVSIRLRLKDGRHPLRAGCVLAACPPHHPVSPLAVLTVAPAAADALDTEHLRHSLFCLLDAPQQLDALALCLHQQIDSHLLPVWYAEQLREAHPLLLVLAPPPPPEHTRDVNHWAIDWEVHLGLLRALDGHGEKRARAEAVCDGREGQDERR
mmetsp:Transcript_12348/g.30077  ORF Transcript_12348/g.30077 Transcript_12348/m.30077 type:complete len:236 (-) Transcript_12348:569-1276(-)